MKILIIDIDSRIPNLALAKINHYHKVRGHHVIWNMLLYIRSVDKIYVSCVFAENRDKCLQYEGIAEIGGSGYDLKKQLPYYIDQVKPRIGLGFTKRGCIRQCTFCIVPIKEGEFRIIGDLLDLIPYKAKRYRADRPKSKVTLLDNNILADLNHTALICQQAQDNNVRIDFNQGLDHRLLDAAIIKILKPVVSGEMRFAFDSPTDEGSVKRAIKMLKCNGVKRAFWYVLIGFNTTFQEDYERVMLLRSHGQTVFLQRFVKNRGNLLFGQWVNQHTMFKAMEFQQFLTIPRYQRYIDRYREEVESYLGVI